jgi:hypothetical protein
MSAMRRLATMSGWDLILKDRVRRTHKAIATTADHIWIARNRGKFILMTRVVWTHPMLCGLVRQ